MKSHGLTLVSSIVMFGVTAILPLTAMASPPTGSPTPAVRSQPAPQQQPMPRAAPVPMPPKVVLPLYQRPTKVVSPDHGPNPAA
jgi:hypothetical protein